MPPKPQLALDTSENKGEAQSPLVLRVNPHLPSISVPGVCQCLDFSLESRCRRAAVPSSAPPGALGCLSPLSPLSVSARGLGAALFGIAFLSRRGWAEQPLQRSAGALSHPPEPLGFSSRVFPVGFCSGAGHFSGGARAGPGCLAVNGLNSKECSEQEQKRSRECSSAERGGR